ncbi:MAG: AAA family ATPase, partial [Ilumatobacteraceae bacterium]
MLHGRTGLSPVMVGRRAALQRLIGLVDVAELGTADGPEIALVSGEAGIGKSRLLREFVAQLPPDVVVLNAQAQPGSLGRPFDVIGQLAPAGSAPSEGAKSTVGQAVHAGRTVLLVEDLHWADADSVHVLEQILLQPWPNLVVVGTYRVNDLSRRAPGGEFVQRLEGQFTVEQIRLDRLDRNEVAALISAIGNADPSSAAVETVFRRSGGIPFVVEELLRCCGTDACMDDLLSAQLPWSLDEAVHQQLAGLQPAERAVVDALAVFGDPASFDMLASLTELPERELLAALRELTRTNVLTEPSNDHFWFAHALVADAVQQQLLGREKRRLHERSLKALQAQTRPDHASLARHAAGAGHFDLIPAIAREGASHYLASGASFQALRLAGFALSEAPSDPDLLRVATDAAWRLDFLQEAVGFAVRWMAVAVDDLDSVEAQRFITRLHHERGFVADRDASLEQLIAFADALPAGTARGRAFGAVAQIMMIAERGDEAVDWARRARREAEANGDDWLVAQAMVEDASAFISWRPLAETEGALRAAYQAALRVGDMVLASRALSNLSSMIIAHSAAGAALRADLLAITESAGFDKLGAGVLALQEAQAAFGSADLRRYRRAIAEAGQRGGDWSAKRSRVLTYGAILALEEGRAAAALASLVEIESTSVNVTDYQQESIPAKLLAAGQLGDRDLAEAVWKQLLGLQQFADTARTLPVVVDIVDSALLAGIDARRVRAELLDGWLGEHLDLSALRAHAQGLLLLAEGDAHAAVVALAAVVEEPDPRLFVPTVASLRHALAVAQLAVGDRKAALRTVRGVVADDLAAWPGWRRDRSEALMHRLEGSTARPEGSLTAREREVAALIAEGLTNGQLAE